MMYVHLRYSEKHNHSETRQHTDHDMAMQPAALVTAGTSTLEIVGNTTHFSVRQAAPLAAFKWPNITELCGCKYPSS